MCGIAGIVGRATPLAFKERLGAEMARRLAHRGPDGEGRVARGGEAVLAHRRLAVIDPAGGHQPMSDASGRYWITYNGEIYNYRALRRMLEERGVELRTQSDTEAILGLFATEGVEGFRRLEGMFAFAIWDDVERRVHLLRDVFGMKPFCYAIVDGEIVFASEAKAILAHPRFERRPDRQAVHDLLNLRFVPSPQTLWAGIRRLTPGQLITFSCESGLAARDFLAVPSGGAPAAGTLNEEIAAAVERHLVSDVPVGLFLSGGLDSGAILASAARSGARLPAFTLGFGDRMDEIDAAARSAAHFGVAHKAMTLEAAAVRADFRSALWHMEEPRVNIMQTFALARFASRDVKVALSGLGGDELFGGYHTHRWFSILAHMGFMPSRSRGAVFLRASLRAINAALGPRTDLPYRGADMILSASDPARSWGILRNVWDENPSVVREVYGDRRPAEILPARRLYEPIFRDRDPLAAVFDAEIRFKLADDFLAAEDRMSMAHGLEIRAPFLDPRLAGFARSIAPHRHVSLGRGKLFYGGELRREPPLLPDFILARPKWGFALDPVEHYESALEPLIVESLSGDALDVVPVSPDYIRKLLAIPRGRTLRWHRYFLWIVAGFAVWHRLFIESDGSSADLGAAA